MVVTTTAGRLQSMSPTKQLLQNGAAVSWAALAPDIQMVVAVDGADDPAPPYLSKMNDGRSARLNNVTITQAGVAFAHRTVLAVRPDAQALADLLPSELLTSYGASYWAVHGPSGA